MGAACHPAGPVRQARRLIRLGGLDYITAAEAPQHLGDDVTPALVRDWARRALLAGHRVGREVYYPLDMLVEVEYATRTSRAGRPRRVCVRGRVPIDASA